MKQPRKVPRIETRRLVLRAPEARDIDAIAALANDIDIARAQTLDLAREAVFVIERDGDGPIGVLGLHPQGALGPEIGYWIGRPYWGQGLASEAACAAMGWAGEDWRRRVVVAGYFADNPASGRVLDRAGFLHTGEIQHRHSLARGETAPTRMMVWLA